MSAVIKIAHLQLGEHIVEARGEGTGLIVRRRGGGGGGDSGRAPQFVQLSLDFLNALRCGRSRRDT